jgi:transposase
VSFNFVGGDRGQSFLLPVSVAEWLPEDHLAWFVLDAVDQLDLTAFTDSYRRDGRGGAAVHPRVMVALLLYAYSTGIVSSRRIEKACLEQVPFRVITGNLVPDHTSIARFRRRHEQALAGLFAQVLRLCARAGMASVGTVALDGTKMGANASMQANRGKDTIARQVDELLAAARDTDAAEDAEHGRATRGGELPAQLRGRSDRLARLQEAKRQLQAQQEAEDTAHEERLEARRKQETASGAKLRGRKPKPDSQKAGAKPARANTTDPDSKMMPTRSRGFLQGYNAQALANQDQIIITAEITTTPADQTLLHPMLTATRTQLAEAGITERVGVLLADAGYATEANLAALTETDPDCYIATRNMRAHPNPRNGQRGPLKKSATHIQRMDRKISRASGQKIYRLRQQIIEPVFGQIKDARGIRRFTRRGVAAAGSEWKLICATHNLLKLHRHTATHPTNRARNTIPA